MNLRKLIRQKLESKANMPKPLPAVVGDGNGNVYVNGRKNYVYVRIGQSLAEAYCDTDVRHGASVLVGYDSVNPRLFRVLNSGGGGETMELITSDRYRWAAPGGGQDPLMVELRQFLPVRIAPAGGLKVSVYPGIAWCGSAWKVVGGSVHDLSSLVPTTSGKAKMVLICINENGSVTLATGSEVNANALSINDLPEPPSGSLYVIGAVRLYAGQTAIREARTNTDIVDLRFPIRHTHSDYLKSDAALNELSDVDITSPQDGDVLGYDASTQTWQNRSGGSGDMLKSVYDTDNDGIVDAAESVDWSGVQNKPTAYPPESHNHDDRYYTESETDTLLAGKSNIGHTHTPGDVGLGNVTNDAQLKRSGDDFAAFAGKTTPANNDIVLMEDSAASNAKKKITIGNIYLWIKGQLDSLYAAIAHNHDASDINSGVLDAARIPNLDASKIASGTLSTDRYSAYADLNAESRIGLVSGRLPTADQVRGNSAWAAVVEDWTSAILPDGWAWAGSPFVTPPSTAVFSGTILYAAGYTTASRSFLFRSVPSGVNLFAGLYLMSAASTYVGIRLDDGTDNNYAEIVLRMDASTRVAFVQIRYRTGGGVANEINPANMQGNWLLTTQIAFNLNMWGTQWSSWSFQPVLRSNNCTIYPTNNVSGLTWTPSRAGIVIQSGSGSGERFGVDWTNF